MVTSKRGSNCSGLCSWAAAPTALSTAQLHPLLLDSRQVLQLTHLQSKYVCPKVFMKLQDYMPGDLIVFLIVRKLSLVFCCKHHSLETFLTTKDVSVFSSRLGLNLGLILHNPPLCIFCYRGSIIRRILRNFGQLAAGCPAYAVGLVWVTSRGPFQPQPFCDLGMLTVSHSPCYWVFNMTGPEVKCPQADSHITPFFGHVPQVMCPETAQCPLKHLGESFPFLWMLFSKAFVPRIEQYYQCLRLCPHDDLSEASIRVSIKL